MQDCSVNYQAINISQMKLPQQTAFCHKTTPVITVSNYTSAVTDKKIQIKMQRNVTFYYATMFLFLEVQFYSLLNSAKIKHVFHLRF
jgi:hypothetical protein